MNLNNEDFDLLILDLEKYLALNYKADSVNDGEGKIYDDEDSDINNEISQLLENMESVFSKKIIEIIRERNISEAGVYNRANIDRRHFEKIRNRKNFNPGKLTVIVLCLALELSFEEASELYKSAGYAFSDSFKIDVIGKYFLERKIYDVSRFKDVLYRVGLLK